VDAFGNRSRREQIIDYRLEDMTLGELAGKGRPVWACVFPAGVVSTANVPALLAAHDDHFPAT
jgi:hypothetical protein